MVMRHTKKLDRKMQVKWIETLIQNVNLLVQMRWLVAKLSQTMQKSSDLKQSAHQHQGIV